MRFFWGVLPKICATEGAFKERGKSGSSKDLNAVSIYNIGCAGEKPCGVGCFRWFGVVVRGRVEVLSATNIGSATKFVTAQLIFGNHQR